jgi:hypothetical protein
MHVIERVGLVLLVRFLVIGLIHLGLNPKFDMSVIFMTNYFSVGCDAPVDSDMLLVT